MKQLFCAVAVILLLVANFVSSAKAQVGALTVGALIQGLEQLITTAEQSAARLIEQGNNALAQQQMLAAGIAKGLIVELRETYKTSLNLTFDKIAGAQTNIASDVEKFMVSAKGLEKTVATDVQSTVYQMQGAANQILSSLPLTKQEPVIYGLMVHDVFSELPKKGYDLELLGFNFTSATLGHKKPIFAIGGGLLPASAVSVQGDRVQIALPEEFKSKIGYSENFCQPRPNFALRTTVYYSRPSGWFWPFKSDKEYELDSTSFGIAAPELFVTNIKFSSTRTFTSDKRETFQKRTAQINVGCEEGAQGNLSYRLPDGAKEIDCQATWVDQQRLKAASGACAVGGQTVTATGSIAGRDRNCFVESILSGGIFRRLVGRRNVCNCPGGGQAFFDLSGTYKVLETKNEALTDRDAGSYRFDDRVDANIPVDSSMVVDEIYADIKRDRCDQVFDTIKLTPPKDPNLALKQSSSKGHFDLEYRVGKLLILQK